MQLDLLSEEQQEVVDSYIAGRNIFVTGSAGSGKSHLLNFLKSKYLNYGLNITASTGIAAVNIGGSTIHSWSGIGLANLPVEEIIRNIISKKFSKVRRKIMAAKSLAIDEISMISKDVFEILDRVFKEIRQNDRPMGGLQILLFGDFLQLPPVDKNGKVDFCFNSPVWHDLNLVNFNLQEIFRQDDQEFIKLLNNLRLGKIDLDDKEKLLSRLEAKDENFAIKPTILTTHNYKVEQVNNFYLKNIVAKEQIYEAQYHGDKFKIEFLKKNCLALEKLHLKIGAQVMMIKNTYQKEGIINGSLGVIKVFSPKKSYPIVEFSNGKLITIKPEEWAVERFDEEKQLRVVDANMVQIPLILSWAITIHKSQGLTLDKISCDLGDVFSPGQAYVALSRARSLKGIFLQSINFDKICASKDAVSFYEDL